MVISKDEKVHVITRRQFDDDLRRHFAGVVDEASEETIRATGYTFIYDQGQGEFIRRKQRRTQLFGIGDAGLIIHVLPKTVDLENLRYTKDEKGMRILTDDQTFVLNISEFGASR